MNSYEHIEKAEELLAYLDDYHGRVSAGLAQIVAMRANAHIKAAAYRKDEETYRSYATALRNSPPG